MELTNIQKNLDKLAELKKANPGLTHIYIRRCNLDNLVIDIPVSHAEMTIRQQPAWEVVASNKQMDEDVEKLFAEEAQEQEQKVDTEDQKLPIIKDTEHPELEVPPRPSEKKPKIKKAKKHA